MWEVAEDCHCYLNKENKPCKPQNFNIKIQSWKHKKKKKKNYKNWILSTNKPFLVETSFNHCSTELQR